MREIRVHLLSSQEAIIDVFNGVCSKRTLKEAQVAKNTMRYSNLSMWAQLYQLDLNHTPA